MKKIAIVMGHFGLKSGGVLSSVLNIVNFLLKKNRIHIFAGKDDFKIPEKLSKQKNLKFTFFSIKHHGFLKVPNYNFNFEVLNNFDLIWFNGAYMGWNKIAKKLNKKYVYTPHGGFSNLLNVDIFRLLRRFFLFFSEYNLIKNAKYVQALSNSEFLFLRKINLKTVQIPNYIFKKKRKIKIKNKKNFCYIGRLDPSKNIPFLIKLSEKSKINIDYYGYFTKSAPVNYQNFLKNSVSFSKNYYGSYKDEKKLSQILQKYNYMILPSKWEGMPIVIYEAIENNVIPVVSNQIKLPNFLNKYILKIDILDFDKSLALIKKLNKMKLQKNKLLLKKALSVCEKNLSGSKYQSFLN